MPSYRDGARSSEQEAVKGSRFCDPGSASGTRPKGGRPTHIRCVVRNFRVLVPAGGGFSPVKGIPGLAPKIAGL